MLFGGHKEEKYCIMWFYWRFFDAVQKHHHQIVSQCIFENSGDRRPIIAMGEISSYHRAAAVVSLWRHAGGIVMAVSVISGSLNIRKIDLPSSLAAIRPIDQSSRPASAPAPNHRIAQYRALSEEWHHIYHHGVAAGMRPFCARYIMYALFVAGHRNSPQPGGVANLSGVGEQGVTGGIG